MGTPSKVTYFLAAGVLNVLITLRTCHGRSFRTLVFFSMAILSGKRPSAQSAVLQTGFLLQGPARSAPGLDNYDILVQRNIQYSFWTSKRCWFQRDAACNGRTPCFGRSSQRITTVIRCAEVCSDIRGVTYLGHIPTKENK